MIKYIDVLPKRKTIRKIMMQVTFSCFPGIMIISYFFGIGILIQLILSSVTVLFTEFLILRIRNKPIMFNLLDGSSVLTACILSCTLSPLSIWWMIIIGSFWSICIKQLYGGLGNNPFNLAMLGHIFLLIFFPIQQQNWIPIKKVFFRTLSVKETLVIIFSDISNKKILLTSMEMKRGSNYSECTSFFTSKDFSVKNTENFKKERKFSFGWKEIKKIMEWVWVNIGFLFGGLYLLYKRIISWHIPISCIFSIFFISSLGCFFIPGVDVPPIVHLFSDTTMLGLFFIATDPVTSPTEKNGKIIFGMLIGVAIWTIRTFGKFPNGSIAFSILLLNLLVPLIDEYSKKIRISTF